ncbi:ABC transporter ATP-binding protein [Desulfitobacterium sp. Sab5]|uniref:ABC transporter ATP-binding protein n=1 Tax=Desulfitobacterium nosdiversum TaxID=3375356 RepID=UPI003CF0C03C
MSLLRASNVAFGYEGQELFRSINFQLQKGEIFCIIGPNGCGKSTLLDCLLGNLKPQAGEIFLKDQNIKTLSPKEMARHVAYVPQDHEKSFPYTVMDIILMGRASYTGYFGTPSAEDTLIAEEALRLLGIEKYKMRPYTKLSGGESQLVMMARALAQQTPVIILDEPTSHLDFKHELLILETLVRLVREKELAVIITTHFPNHAFYFENNSIPTRVAMMNQKTFSVLGKPSEVLSEENIKSVYDVNAKVISYEHEDKEFKQIVPLKTLA